MRVGIHQLHYLPWLRYFHKILGSETFVVLDNIQFNKNGWQNRNRIKTANGSVVLTVPVRARHRANLDEIEIDNTRDWRKKHWESIRQAYVRAPYFRNYGPRVEAIYTAHWYRLNDLNSALLRLFVDALEISTPIVFASDLGVGGNGTDRLVNLVKAVGGDRYYSGAYALDAYLDEDRLMAANIELDLQNWCSPRYLQLHGAYIPDLSILDLVMNCGPEARRILGQPADGRFPDHR